MKMKHGDPWLIREDVFPPKGKKVAQSFTETETAIAFIIILIVIALIIGIPLIKIAGVTNHLEIL